MDVVFRFAKRITVLVQGAVLTDGTPGRDRRAMNACARSIWAKSRATTMAEHGARIGLVFAGYGETVVLEDLRLALGAGETLSIIGRNGVGKTTLLATVMGHTTLHGGAIRLHGRDCREAQDVPAFTGRARLRAAGARDFSLAVPAGEPGSRAARPGAWTIDAVFALFPRLGERQNNRGNQLSGGEQQMLAIARALSAIRSVDPDGRALRRARAGDRRRAGARCQTAASADGLTHRSWSSRTRALALDISPRTVVMDRGRVVYDGASAALRADPAKLEQLIGVGKR